MSIILRSFAGLDTLPEAVFTLEDEQGLAGAATVGGFEFPRTLTTPELVNGFAVNGGGLRRILTIPRLHALNGNYSGVYRSDLYPGVGFFFTLTFASVPRPREGDVDGDGILDSQDPDTDTDGDGIPDVMDDDDDNDGIPDSMDPDDDGDGIRDGLDPGHDTDGDGDADVDDLDDDNDGINDAEDDDDDGDGILDTEDPDTPGQVSTMEEEILNPPVENENGGRGGTISAPAPEQFLPAPLPLFDGARLLECLNNAGRRLLERYGEPDVDLGDETESDALNVNLEINHGGVDHVVGQFEVAYVPSQIMGEENSEFVDGLNELIGHGRTFVMLGVSWVYLVALVELFKDLT